MDLGDPEKQIANEIDRLAGQQKLTVTVEDGIQKVRLVSMVKAYQSGVAELSALEEWVRKGVESRRSEGGWHRVTELLPPAWLKPHQWGIARRYPEAVVEWVVQQLREEEGWRSRSGASGEEVCLARCDEATAPTSPPQATSPAALHRAAGGPQLEGATTAGAEAGNHESLGELRNPQTQQAPTESALAPSAVEPPRLPEAESPAALPVGGAAGSGDGDPGTATPEVLPLASPGRLPPAQPQGERGEAAPQAATRAKVGPNNDNAATGEERTALPARQRGRNAEVPSPGGQSARQDRGAAYHPFYGSKTTMSDRFANTLEVEGPSQEVDRFLPRARGHHAAYRDEAGEGDGQREALLSFNALYPVPPDVLRAGHSPAGERWQREHWGCPADIDPATVLVRRVAATRVEYRFETAGAPPLKWLKRVAEDFPGLDFDLYYIAPWELHGRHRYVRGQLVEDWEEQPTAEDHARAGIIGEDYCPACGDPLGEDDRNCPHCAAARDGESGGEPEAGRPAERRSGAVG
jgi:hypothetical protein